ncbi:MAG TPA: hydantoinase B/oxoprolinase family protein [Gemmatimonadota bacterium]|nr:hydantoinase B/oxoprolinase family protein [Gemmatimonadota bacterium]
MTGPRTPAGTPGTERASPPLDLGVFRDLFVALTEEMAVVLQRTAHSPNVVERRDHSCALYDGAGRALAMGDHMPVHLGSMPLAVAAVRSALELGPGDVAIVNDPGAGGTHLPDLTLVQGVWLEGDRRPAFFLADRAHHADVGGRSAGSMPLSTDLWEEGVVLPPVRLVAAGRPVGATWRHLLANVRTPEEREGDLAAQLAALATGERRLRALVERHGRDRIERMGAELVAYSARAVRALLAGLPDGGLEFEDALDDDGFGSGPVWIRVRVEISGERAVFDFTGTSPAVAGPVNAVPAIVRSAVFYVLRALLDEAAPANDGILEPVEIVVPRGSLLDPPRGSAVAAGNVETSQRLTDTILGALAPVLPETIPAASQGTMNNLALGGRDRTGRAVTYYETVAGGAGGHPDGPGASGVHTHMTNSRNSPIEALERALPVRVRCYARRAGSGGAGRHPGGDGLVREIEALAPLEGTLLADRRARGPWGLAGGAPGAPGADRVLRADGREERLPAKAAFRLAPGDRLEVETPGGGGWGPT